MEAFVYCWTDHKREMLYIGAHKGTQDDGYVCSSKTMIKEYRERSGDFTRQIIACGTWKDMLRFEQRLIENSGAVKDSHYYNQAYGLGPYHSSGASTIEHRRRISESMVGRKQTPEHTAQQCKSRTGKKRTLETKTRLREAWVKRKQRGELPWNKGKVGVQVAWNKGHKKEKV